MKKVTCTALTLVLTLLISVAWAGSEKDLAKLGGLLYKDKNLSLNKNQSCKTCHHSAAGFADPENLRDPISFPVSDGSDPTLFGGRNAPSAAYAGFSPVFSWDDAIGGYVGGMFWDGRATGERLGDPLAEQALGPFLNPVEMGMEKSAVVLAVSVSNYADLFARVFRGTDFTDVDGTYDNIGRAIAAFERGATVTQFNSLFDKFWAACRQRGIDVSSIDTATNLTTLPEGILSATQLQGLALFNDTAKGNCAACHPTTDYIDSAGTLHPPLFTDFSYDNIGLPTNPRVEYLSGVAPPDLGLGGFVEDSSQDGKFKVPTLRNVAKSAPYGHNGYFPTLQEIVIFFNTRDAGMWDDPEVAATVNFTELGELGLTRQEELQLVSFLGTLTDQE